MIKKTDWQAAYRDVVREGRQRLGDPPTYEELQAYFEGELLEERASRVRELLACYPELVKVLAQPFPFPYEGKPGDPDFLTDEELDQDWKALQERVTGVAAANSSADGDASSLVTTPMQDLARERTPERPRPHAARGPLVWLAELFARAFKGVPVAAAVGYALAVIFVGLYLQARREALQLTHELRQPRINAEHRLLLPDGQRGPDAQPAIVLSAEADHFLLRPALVVRGKEFPDYRLDIVDLGKSKPERIWSRMGLRRRNDDTFEIWIPRTFLQPGEYRLELYGLGKGREAPLATYTFRLLPGGA